MTGATRSIARYDAVVIGAGHNSLVAAATLARAGRRVVVLERGSRPGGVAAAEEVYPGFHFDTGLYNLSMLRPEIVRELDLARHGLELIRAEATAAVLLPDGGALQLWEDPARSADSLGWFSAADAAALPAFSAEMARLARVLEALEAVPLPDLHSQDPGEWLGAARLAGPLRRLGRAALPSLLRTLAMPVAGVLDDVFESDWLKGALGASGVMHLHQGPRAQGTGCLFLHHLVGSPDGAFRAVVRARGGAGALGRALAASAHAAGAEIRLNSEVVHVPVRDGRVEGVVLASGEQITAREVAAGTDVRSLFLGLIEAGELEPAFLDHVAHVRYRGASARVNYALDGLPSFRAAPGDGPFLRGALSPAASLDDLERAYDDAKYGRIPARPYFEATLPSLADPSLAPAGKHVMTVHVQPVPYRLAGGWTDAQREMLGDRVTADLADLAPDLPARVLARQVLVPPDFEARFGVTEGNLYHAEMTLDQMFLARPVPACARYRTPIEGLYLCGASAHPGGGLSGQAGRSAAREMLRA